MGEFKDIEYLDDSVIITHHLLEDYQDREEPQYSYETYKEHILKCYYFAESKNLCKIINIGVRELKVPDWARSLREQSSQAIEPSVPPNQVTINSGATSSATNATYEETIQIKMKRYKMLLSQDRRGRIIKETTTPEALCKLFKWMHQNQAFQIDFAPRNIGIDENGDLHLIDVDTIFELTLRDNDYVRWIKDNQFEFTHAGFGDIYEKAYNLYQSSLVGHLRIQRQLSSPH